MEEGRVKERLSSISHVLSVISGKGGVGKSTVSVNLSYSLAKKGFKVGLMDADITGPNLPKLLGIENLEPEVIEKEIIPLEREGVKVISIGLLTHRDFPIIWRGPLRSKAIIQFISDVRWGKLDFLVVDLPPGTGDEAITTMQVLKPEVSLVVTTPQDLSLLDARKALNMSKYLKIKVIGVIENMSFLRCPNCGERIEIFGKGGGMKLAKEFGVEYLGEVPFDLEARKMSDLGRIPVLESPNTEFSEKFNQISDRIIQIVS